MGQKFTCTIDMDNAAFDEWPNGELLRIIQRDLAEHVEQGSTSGSLFDVNGNRVGVWKITGRRAR